MLRPWSDELCPFELSLEMLKRVDVTVCDYNYVYDPAAFDRMEAIDRSRTILIVDEAHNLYSRAREYFSPQLALGQIRGATRKASAAASGSATKRSHSQCLPGKSRPRRTLRLHPRLSWRGWTISWSGSKGSFQISWPNIRRLTSLEMRWCRWTGNVLWSCAASWMS